MAKINVTQGTAGAYGAGELQLENKVQMTATLTPVTDNLNTASPLKLSTALVQSTSTIKITTSDVAYIDAEDNSGNNRFTVSRAVASQLVTVDFASLPTALTTAVGAIRTATDGVNLANVMTFLENGNIGINTDTAGAKLDVHSGANVIAQFNRTGTGKSWIQYLQAGTGRWNTGFDNVNGNFTIYDVVNSLDRLVVTNAGLVGIGTTTPSAKLQVVGSGLTSATTSLLVQNSASSTLLGVFDSGRVIFGNSSVNQPYLINFDGISTEGGTGQALRIRQQANINGILMQYFADGLFNNTTSGNNISHDFVATGYRGATGNGNYNGLRLSYTINNVSASTQTGTATGILLNATETSLSGQTHNLIDLQVGGSSKFKVDNVGAISIGNTVASAVAVASTHKVTVVIGGTTYYLLATNI